jgi:hypothetical protein
MLLTQVEDQVPAAHSQRDLLRRGSPVAVITHQHDRFHRTLLIIADIDGAVYELTPSRRGAIPPDAPRRKPNPHVLDEPSVREP